MFLDILEFRKPNNKPNKRSQTCAKHSIRCGKSVKQDLGWKVGLTDAVKNILSKPWLSAPLFNGLAKSEEAFYMRVPQN